MGSTHLKISTYTGFEPAFQVILSVQASMCALKYDFICSEYTYSQFKLSRGDTRYLFQLSCQTKQIMMKWLISERDISCAAL